MSPGHYAWRSFRRTGRQFGLLAVLVAVGFLVLVALLVIFGGGE
jgi:hypothetical protein